jgi:predicted NAD/FAD-binding protein
MLKIIYVLYIIMTKQKIAIIGGGTGLTLAWLLSDTFDVTLYESQNHLGGHINSIKISTVTGKDATVEGGAEFLNPEYKYFFRLLEELKIELSHFTMSMEFNHLVKQEHLVFSPNMSDLVDNFKILPKNKTSNGLFDELEDIVENFSKIEDLVTLEYVIHNAKKTVIKNPSNKTIVEFIDSLDVNKNFQNNLFYPVIAASWGVSINTIKTFCAHYAMNYLCVGVDFYEVSGGLSRYIQELQARIEKKVTIQNVDNWKNYIMTLLLLQMQKYHQISSIICPNYRNCEKHYEK